MGLSVSSVGPSPVSSAPAHLSHRAFAERLEGASNSVVQFASPTVVVTDSSFTTRDARAEVWKQAGNDIFGTVDTNELVNLALYGNAGGKKLHALKLLNLALASSYVDLTVDPDQMAEAKMGLGELAHKLLNSEEGKVNIVGLALGHSEHSKQAGKIEKFLNKCVKDDRLNVFARAESKLSQMLPAGFKAGFENHYGVKLTPESVAEIAKQGHASTTATSHAFDRIHNAIDHGDLYGLVTYIVASLEQLDLYRPATPAAALPPARDNAPPAPNGRLLPGVQVNDLPTVTTLSRPEARPPGAPSPFRGVEV